MNYRHIVKWYDQSCGFNMAWVYDSMKKDMLIEVIGNIYENPELLKEKSNGHEQNK